MTTKLYNFINLFVCLILVASCASIATKVVGVKNPVVYNEQKIEPLIKEWFPYDSDAVDVSFESVRDSVGLYRLFLSSFNGDVILYDKSGNRVCVDGKQSCSALKFRRLAQDFEENIGKCVPSETDKNYFNLQSIDQLKERFVTYEEDNFDKLINTEFVALFFWSSFSSGKKRMQQDYEIFESSVKSIDKNIGIIRVNCDLKSSWGLEEGAKWKMKWKKGKTSKQMIMVYGDIPYSN